MGLEKEFEMMVQEKLEDGEKKMFESAACTPFYHIARPIFLPHATERERPTPTPVLSLIKAIFIAQVVYTTSDHG